MKFQNCFVVKDMMWLDVYMIKKKEAVHRIVYSGDVESLKIFQGSKYIQSSTIDAFTNVINKSKKQLYLEHHAKLLG